MYQEDQDELNDQFHGRRQYSREAPEPPAVGSRSIEEAYPVKAGTEEKRPCYVLVGNLLPGLFYAVVRFDPGERLGKLIATFDSDKDAQRFISTRLDADATPAPF